jgi:hypothetical protein
MWRTLVELFHILVGLVATVVIAWGSAWAVPLAASAIWWVALACGVAVVAMGIRPLVNAMAEDRARTAGRARG